MKYLAVFLGLVFIYVLLTYVRSLQIKNKALKAKAEAAKLTDQELADKLNKVGIVAFLVFGSLFGNINSANAEDKNSLCITGVPVHAEVKLLCTGDPAPWSCYCIDRTRAEQLYVDMKLKSDEEKVHDQIWPNTTMIIVMIGIPLATFGIGVGTGLVIADKF